jgi:hypothetical protein
MQYNRESAELRLFDPHQGAVVAEPLGNGPGWWAGAPGACLVDGRIYLVYRLRRPQPVRGGDVQIAVSDDGEHFETIWRTTKAALGTPSIERNALVRTDTGAWRLYLSFVDPADGRWRIDMLEAASPDAFDVHRRAPALTAGSIGAEGVKDPWLCRVNGVWHMLVSFVPTPPALPDDPQAMHATADIYNTGYSRSLTGLATSTDAVSWTWEGAVLTPPQSGWDAYATRINTAVAAGPLWVGYYDGSASVAENYEERCGLAVSRDLRRWHRLSEEGPAIGSAGGPGAVRYVEAIQTEAWTRYYYEYTRPDGAHELRTILETRSL